MSMLAEEMEVYTVPLKGGDENEQTMSARTRHLVGESEHPQDDAFSRYSSNFVRMKSLLLNVDEDDGSEHDDDDLDALARINRALSSAGLSNVVNLNRDKRRRGNNSASIRQGSERKTRLTWELHPDLLLHDLIEEFEALDNGVQRIVDDEDETETSASEEKPPNKVLEQETQQKEE